MHDLGVETDVKSNEREKEDLHHPLSLRDGAQQSERSIQAKRCGASQKASVIVLITCGLWVGSETYGKLTVLCVFSDGLYIILLGCSLSSDPAGEEVRGHVLTRAHNDPLSEV